MSQNLWWETEMVIILWYWGQFIIKVMHATFTVLFFQSCPTLLYSPWSYPGQIIGAGSISLPQGIFPTQGSSPGLLHCRQILYQLSHKGSPRILEWVAFPFSSGSSRPRDRTGVSCIAGRFFTNWAFRWRKWEGNLKQRRDMYMYNWFTLLFSRN